MTDSTKRVGWYGRCCRKNSESAAAAGAVLPALALTLLPKCPMCIAAYVGTISGIGISAPVATQLRTGLMVLLGVSVAALTTRLIVTRWNAPNRLPRVTPPRWWQPTAD